MRGKKSNKNICILLFIVMTILFVTNIIRWGLKKEGFFGDELYTYNFVCQTEYPSINADRGEITYLNNWHDADYYKDYLTVSGDERFDIIGTYNSIKQGDPHPPLYYILMEISCSVFSVDRFTKWTGIGLNLAFFVLTLVMLFLCAKKYQVIYGRPLEHALFTV